MEIGEQNDSWHHDSTPLAFVYIRHSGDQRNMIKLTNEALVIVRKGRQQVFDRSELHGLEFQGRFLLLPLVAGGVLLPFGIAAMFGGFINPYVVVLLVLAGMYLLYEGLTSRWVLTVHGKGSRSDVPLDHPTDNLRAFAEFVNAQLKGHSGSDYRYIYTIMPTFKFRTFDGERFIDPGHSPYKAYTSSQWRTVQQSLGKDQQVLCLDPTDDLLRVDFIRDRNDGGLYPHIVGMIPRKAIVGTP